MKTAGKLVVLGSINADHILNLDAFPTPGETVTGHHYQVAFGGKGANGRLPPDAAGQISPLSPVPAMTILANAFVVNWKVIYRRRAGRSRYRRINRRGADFC